MCMCLCVYRYKHEIFAIGMKKKKYGLNKICASEENSFLCTADTGQNYGGSIDPARTFLMRKWLLFCTSLSRLV